MGATVELHRFHACTKNVGTFNSIDALKIHQKPQDAQLCETGQTTEPTDTRALVLRGLPITLGDDSTDFYKPGFDSDDDSYFHIDFGILLTEHESAVLSSSSHPCPASLKIIIEGNVVMDNIKDLPKAMCILFGLAYALHLDYPKSIKLTFQ